MARLSFALPILDRCERPSTASVSAWRLQPGRLAHGPDEKCGMTGRTPGGLLMTLSFQIEAPRWGGVARGRYSEARGKAQHLRTFGHPRLAGSRSFNPNIARTGRMVWHTADTARGIYVLA